VEGLIKEFAINPKGRKNRHHLQAKQQFDSKRLHVVSFEPMLKTTTKRQQNRNKTKKALTLLVISACNIW